MAKIFPVIHHLTDGLALEQAIIAFHSGADGVFLISHEGNDMVLPSLGEQIKTMFPHFQVGINFLSHPIMTAAKSAKEYGLDMVWGDSCGVSSLGLDSEGRELSSWAKDNPAIEVFASVAFKGQRPEVNPVRAVLNALEAGFIPTTSGSRTGSAPSVDKIKTMSVGGTLAIASGMKVENVLDFTPYLSHILVATGVSLDDHNFNPKLLIDFINKVKS